MDDLSNPNAAPRKAYTARRDASASPLPGATMVGERSGPIPVQMVDFDEAGMMVPRQVDTVDIPEVAAPKPPATITRTVTPAAIAQPISPGVDMVTPKDAQVVTAKRRIKVKFSNPGMGRITTFVDSFAISDNIIILAYVEDGSTAVVEPPDCGLDNPVTIELASNTYKCMYQGFSANLDGRFMIVLIRIPNDA